MRDHRTLGTAGRTRGVDQNRHVVGTRGRRLALEPTGIPLVFPAADPAKLVQEQNLSVGKVVQAFPVQHDALPDPLNPVADFEELVQLLRVLGDQEPAVGVPEQERDLLRTVGRIDAGDDTAHALDTEIRVNPLLVVFREHRDHLAPGQAQRGKPQADRPGGVEELRPGAALPDTEMLFAVGGPPPQRLAAAKEQLRKGVAAFHETGNFVDTGVGTVRLPIRCLAPQA